MPRPRSSRQAQFAAACPLRLASKPHSARIALHRHPLSWRALGRRAKTAVLIDGPNAPANPANRHARRRTAPPPRFVSQPAAPLCYRHRKAASAPAWRQPACPQPALHQGRKGAAAVAFPAIPSSTSGRHFIRSRDDLRKPEVISKNSRLRRSLFRFRYLF